MSFPAPAQSATVRQRPEPSSSSNATAPAGHSTRRQRWLATSAPSASELHGFSTVLLWSSGCRAARASGLMTTPPPQKFC